jgi:creatinine amidohydrolase
MDNVSPERRIETPNVHDYSGIPSRMTTESDAQSGILEEMTIEDVEAFDPETVVFGIGSTEPHGPHLPYGTDVFQVDALCRRTVTRANERGASALMYPTLPIGNNVNFKEYPFACRIGVRTLMEVVLDIVEAIEEEGVRKVVIVNGHGGNTDTLRATLREHAGRNSPGEGAFVCLTGALKSSSTDPDHIVEHPSPHAGESETSRVMHLRPDLVREDELDEFPMREPTVDGLDSDRVEFVPPWHGFMPESAGGETRESSAEKGEAIIDETADWLADFLVDLEAAEIHAEFPYPEQGDEEE